MIKQITLILCLLLTPMLAQADPYLDMKEVVANKTHIRMKVVNWVQSRSQIAGAFTHLLVAKPDTGWHLSVDPGDEVMLEWQITF